MTKSKFTPEEQLERRRREVEKLENEIKRLRHLSSVERRRARTRRLIMIGGEIESRVGRELKENEARAIGNVAWMLLESEPECMGAFNDGGDIREFFLKLSRLAAHKGEQNYQMRKAAETEERHVPQRDAGKKEEKDAAPAVVGAA